MTSTTTGSSSSPPPMAPVARREEDRVVWAGVAPEGWDESILRQSEESHEALLDPPVPIPDPYGWLRSDKRDNQEVLEHLKQENAFTSQAIQHLQPLQKELYHEFLKSLQETDYTTPRPRGQYWYYTRTIQGLAYKKYCRAPKTSNNLQVDWNGSAETPILDGEEVYLDPNVLSKDKDYCDIGTVKPFTDDPTHRYIAYTVDYKGDEIYQVVLLDLETGTHVPLMVHGDNSNNQEPQLLQADSSLVWGGGDTSHPSLFYLTLDDQHRPFRLWRRRDVLQVFNGQQQSVDDTLLMEELDPIYWAHVGKSLDGQYIFWHVASSETSEIWYLPTDGGGDQLNCIAKRRSKVLYDVEHGHSKWWITTNVDQSPNMKFMSSPAVPDSADQWQLVVDENGQAIFNGENYPDGKSVDSITVLQDFIVLEGRQDGIPKIWMYKDGKCDALTFPEPAHDVGLLGHYEFDSQNTIAVAYDSMVTPPESWLIHPSDNTRTLLKAKQVPGYQKELYACERLTVPSSQDNGATQIPISVVYRKDVMEKVKNGSKVPVHLYGYGSYGSCCEADFDATRLPLLERGMIYVIAHVRGGGELGRTWYEAPNGAKYLCKQNTFYDFVDVAKFLVHGNNNTEGNGHEGGWTTPDLLSCEGRSAGGMLIGASINMAPELFRCAILAVPFVDVVGTMTDASIPLTSGEWEEWGNPNEVKYHKYMMEYSPLHNVRANANNYPACWLTCGLHDPRVAYWEPTKLVSTLRYLNPNNRHPFLLKIDMSVGHFSASDRYKYYHELSTDYAFLLDQLGLAGDTSTTTKE